MINKIDSLCKEYEATIETYGDAYIIYLKDFEIIIDDNKVFYGCDSKPQDSKENIIYNVRQNEGLIANFDRLQIIAKKFKEAIEDEYAGE